MYVNIKLGSALGKKTTFGGKAPKKMILNMNTATIPTSTNIEREPFSINVNKLAYPF